jgi:predicted lipoprotein with Yx(FWY)xxD motif
VLVTNKGDALYVFPPDRASRVSCADGWPPLVVPAGDSVAAGDGVRADLLGTMPAHGGTRVVTYHGWLLYTYLGDAGPGHAAGRVRTTTAATGTS